MQIGRYEADRVERRALGGLCLVEVRLRRTSTMAMTSVGRMKQRRLAMMAKHLAESTGETVTIEVEAIGQDGVNRRTLGCVQPDVIDRR